MARDLLPRRTSGHDLSMNFASLQFGCFLILLLAANALLRRHEHRNTLMLVAGSA